MWQPGETVEDLRVVADAACHSEDWRITMRRLIALESLPGLFALVIAATASTVSLGQSQPPRPSEAECAARADRAARDSTGVMGGAVAGGVGGAAFGAIVSDKRSKGAARGAALGAVVGGAAGAHRKNDVYKRVYDDCMRGR